MKKFLSVILIVFAVLGGNINAQNIEIADEPNKIEPVLQKTQSFYCLETGESCAIDFLENVVCEIDSLLCFSDENSTEFSWGLAVSLYWGILSEFQMPAAESIEQNTTTAEEKADFVDQQALEYLICRLDSDLCVSNSKDPTQRDSTNESIVCKKYPPVCES